jgi:hypothetical protein
MSDILRRTLKAAFQTWLSLWCVAESLQGAHERKLLNDLLATYNTLERPVANESEPLEVKFGLTLQQIIDVVSFNVINTCKLQTLSDVPVLTFRKTLRPCPISIYT